VPNRVLQGKKYLTILLINDSVLKVVGIAHPTKSELFLGRYIRKYCMESLGLLPQSVGQYVFGALLIGPLFSSVLQHFLFHDWNGLFIKGRTFRKRYVDNLFIIIIALIFMLVYLEISARL